MKNNVLRRPPFWVLVALSVLLAVAGAVVIAQHLGTMTKTLADGSATGLEVYAGQSWIVVGAALLGIGGLGILLSLLALIVAGLLTHRDTPAPATEQLDASRVDLPTDASDEDGASAENVGDRPGDDATRQEEDPTSDPTPKDEDRPEDEDQKGSSGSTATATKISVR
ncbi:hypothetical protein [uncultured Microbacterium sp.]|uniref:hypothetical protein n=1 Tax=uncultured Microbacterium sp. TaxID=191216 RepID=UPI0025FC0820|nr:hypothetical protein [uncultured Microbacterium sp.]